MKMSVGKVLLDNGDINRMFGQVERHYLERIHILEEKVKRLEGTRCSEAAVGELDEDCKNGS